MLIKMLKIGFTNIFASIMPIVLWFLIGVLYNNRELSQGFSLVYPYQFLFMALANVLITSQVKCEAKHGHVSDFSNSGVVLYILSGIGIIVLSFIFRKEILSFYSFSYEEYTSVFLYSLSMLVMDYTIYYYNLLNQYESKHKDAILLNVIWYLTRVISVILSAYSDSSYVSGLIDTLFIQFIILILILSRRLHWNKFRIDIISGFKYSCSDLPYNILMLLIYGVGYSQASVVSGIYTSYNIEGMCSDTQWDILESAIDTAVTSDLCEYGIKRYRKAKISSVFYSLILFVSSLCMILGYYLLYPDVDIKRVLFIFVLECTSFPIYAIFGCIEAKIVLYTPTPIIGVFVLISYCIRFLVTILVKSEYALSIGLIICTICTALQWIIISLYYNKKKKVRE